MRTPPLLCKLYQNIDRISNAIGAALLHLMAGNVLSTIIKAIKKGAVTLLLINFQWSG
jgi:hypothetical protein